MKMYPEYQQFKPKAGAAPRLQPTGKDIEGPFYVPGAPFRDSLHDKPTLLLSGTVTDTDGNPVPAAVLDFWQADEAGVYDNDGFNLRGKVIADKGGGTSASGNCYRLQTIRPGNYPISDTEFRCAHIHVKVTAEGYKPLTTQLYFVDDKYDAADHWFDPARCVQFTDRNMREARFDFVLEKE